MKDQLRRIGEMWCSALGEYRQDGLKDRLPLKWPHDKNVTERISYDYPPTFQPGYVGPQYFDSRRRLVLVAQNPCEGSDQASQDKDRVYLQRLEHFRDGTESFGELNQFLGQEIVSWPVFVGKGIFREGGSSRISLLSPANRLAIDQVAYLNSFPFKTLSSDNTPLRTAFRRHAWDQFVGKVLAFLEPDFVVYVPDAHDLVVSASGLPSHVRLVQVWHPSRRNMSPRRLADLKSKWRFLDSLLSSSEPTPRADDTSCGGGVQSQATPLTITEVPVVPPKPGTSIAMVSSGSPRIFRPKEGYALLLKILLDHLGIQMHQRDLVKRVMERTFLPFQESGSPLAQWDRGTIVYLPDCEHVQRMDVIGWKLKLWTRKALGLLVAQRVPVVNDLFDAVRPEVCNYDMETHLAAMVSVETGIASLASKYQV